MHMDTGRMDDATLAFSTGLLNCKFGYSITVLCGLLGASFLAASPTGGIALVHNSFRSCVVADDQFRRAPLQSRALFQQLHAQVIPTGPRLGGASK